MKAANAVKVFATQAIAKGIATKKTKATGVEHVVFAVEGGFKVFEAPVEVKKTKAPAPVAKPEAKPAKARKSEKMVAETFHLVGEDAKYVTVTVRDKNYKIAKSRAEIKVSGDVVRVAVTAKYASHRPELAFTVQ